jgi:hypothetical protein
MRSRACPATPSGAANRLFHGLGGCAACKARCLHCRDLRTRALRFAISFTADVSSRAPIRATKLLALASLPLLALRGRQALPMRPYGSRQMTADYPAAQSSARRTCIRLEASALPTRRHVAHSMSSQAPVKVGRRFDSSQQHHSFKGLPSAAPFSSRRCSEVREHRLPILPRGIRQHRDTRIPDRSPLGPRSPVVERRPPARI